MITDSFYEPSMTLTPKPDDNTHTHTHTHTHKENYRPISLMNTDAKLLSKIFVNQFQQHIKKIIFHDQVGLIPEM
jgi:hypothetical protein